MSYTFTVIKEKRSIRLDTRKHLNRQILLAGEEKMEYIFKIVYNNKEQRLFVVGCNPDHKLWYAVIPQ